jgi:hypothetical protein
MNNTNLPIAAAAPTTDHDDYDDVIDDIEVELGNQEEKQEANQEEKQEDDEDDEDNDELTIRMKEHNDRLVNDLRKLDHKQYFEEARIRCFPEVKLNFMHYFLLFFTFDRRICGVGRGRRSCIA